MTPVWYPWWYYQQPPSYPTWGTWVVNPSVTTCGTGTTANTYTINTTMPPSDGRTSG